MKLILVCFLLTIISCKGQEDSLPLKLRFIDDVNILTGATFKKSPLGGLSAIFYDNKKKRLLAVSDDRSIYAPARYYQFSFKLNEDVFDVYPEDLIILKGDNGLSFPPSMVDFEGLVLLNNGSLLISSEGDAGNVPRIAPKLYEFKLDGTFVKNWPVDQKFIPEISGKQTKGVRDNLAFENLSIDPLGKTVFIATEDTIFQDGEITGQRINGHSRVVRYKKMDGKFQVLDEYIYLIDPIPNPTNLDKIKGNNGLVDLVALDDGSFLAMERSWVSNTKKNNIRIYHVTINKNATNVLNLKSIKESSVVPLPKKLILNLDEVIPFMDENYKRLDNLEGICLGPKLKNGNRTLILVSDNNFSKHQRTLFIALEILP